MPPVNENAPAASPRPMNHHGIVIPRCFCHSRFAMSRSPPSVSEPAAILSNDLGQVLSVDCGDWQDRYGLPF